MEISDKQLMNSAISTLDIALIFLLQSEGLTVQVCQNQLIY